MGAKLTHLKPQPVRSERVVEAHDGPSNLDYFVGYFAWSRDGDFAETPAKIAIFA